MQPSTWNDTNQHWVSQFLLKGFGIKGNAAKVWQLDKRTGLVEICQVKSAASKQQLMTDRDDELMKRIEIQATGPISNIRKRKLRITEKDRKAIDQLVAAMMQYDPYNGVDHEKARREAVDAVSESVIEAFEHSGGDVDLEDLKQLLDSRLNHDYLANSINDGQSLVLDVLRLMGLQAIYAPPEETFVIGDSPVLAVRGRGSGGPSLLNRGSQVILPISSHCLLFYSWAMESNLIADGDTIDRRQLASLNRDYYHHLNCRFLFGRTKECLIRARQRQLNWGGERSTYVSQGWLALQENLGVVRAQNAAKGKQDAEMLLRGAREIVRRAASQGQ